MKRYTIEGTTLTNIANAIRSKTGSTEPIQVMEMANEIGNINGTGEDVTAETNDYTTKVAQLESAVTALETELAGKASGSGANFETSIVTINVPIECRYLSTDFQPKQEITSTFETVKNSIAYIGGSPVAGSGYTILVANGPNMANTTKTAVQFIEASVNIIVYTGGGGGMD